MGNGCFIFLDSFSKSYIYHHIFIQFTTDYWVSWSGSGTMWERSNRWEYLRKTAAQINMDRKNGPVLLTMASYKLYDGIVSKTGPFFQIWELVKGSEWLSQGLRQNEPWSLEIVPRHLLHIYLLGLGLPHTEVGLTSESIIGQLSATGQPLSTSLFFKCV